MAEERKIVQTDEGAKDGQTKCPKCGSTDISLNSKTGKLRCNFCRFEFEPEKTEGWEDDISKLEGEVVGSGLNDISPEAVASSLVTMKCTSCGAEVVVDVNETANARCHWCRNILSVNEQVPNGMIPDMVLPFKLTKDEAKRSIETFVGQRKFFANSQFKKEFTTDNVMGIYLPYVVVDVNAHSTLAGEGEHLVRSYTRGNGDNRETRYDADVYHVERDFDVTITGLTVESSSDKLNTASSAKTNNIINAIMPFDTENCVKWDANYLRGFSSEKRDTNIDPLRNIVKKQAKDIARYSANKTLQQYDRGVRWEQENLDIKGEQWKTAYLPVWLYSYQQKNGSQKGLLHYVAVNARTRETIGSVPINMSKLVFVSILVELFSGLTKFFIVDKMVQSDYTWLILTSGVLFFWYMYSRYRNSGARHSYETETKSDMANVRGQDIFIRRETGLRNSRIEGANGGGGGFGMPILGSLGDAANIVKGLNGI